jgi:hypothetical protein
MNDWRKIASDIRQKQSSEENKEFIDRLLADHRFQSVTNKLSREMLRKSPTITDEVQPQIFWVFLHGIIHRRTDACGLVSIDSLRRDLRSQAAQSRKAMAKKLCDPKISNLEIAEDFERAAVLHRRQHEVEEQLKASSLEPQSKPRQAFAKALADFFHKHLGRWLDEEVATFVRRQHL